MLGQTTSDAAVSELRRELTDLSDQGAGIAELLDELQRRRRRFSRRRLTKNQLDELSRYCWSLQQAKSNGLLWGRAREMRARRGIGDHQCEDIVGAVRGLGHRRPGQR